MYLLLAISCSRYTMHLIKILITATSPLCTLEKEKLWSFRKRIKNLLDDCKRTLDDIKRKIPYLRWQLSMAGCRLYEAQTWIEMACNNAWITPDIISCCQDPDRLGHITRYKSAVPCQHPYSILTIGYARNHWMWQ